MAKKRVANFKEEYKKFLTFMDGRLKKIKLNGYFELYARRYRVMKINYLIQGITGARTNEGISLDKADLQLILRKDTWEYVVSKVKRGSASKMRVVNFLDYPEFKDEYKILKQLISDFLDIYNDGLFPAKDKKAVYKRVVDEKYISKKVESLRKKLKLNLFSAPEINKHVKRLKELPQNRVGFVISVSSVYVVTFISSFNQFLAICFGSDILDKDKTKHNPNGAGRIKKTESEKAKRTARYTTHSLRAGFITSQYVLGKDITTIQKDIKHENIQQTNSYITEVDVRMRVRPTVESERVVEVKSELDIRTVKTKSGITLTYKTVTELKELIESGVLDK